MARNLERRPTHPGRLLRGEIEARELNQGQVADLVGVRVAPRFVLKYNIRAVRAL